MKKRVLSALLVLCMACSMVSTVWATETNATSGAPEPASQTLNLDNEQSGNESGADSTGAPSDSTDSTSASSDSTSSGSSSAASDATSGAVSDATSGEGDESAASSDSTAASDSTSSSSSASSDSSDSNADDPNAASSDVTGDESGTGAEEESDPVAEQPSAGNDITVTEDSGDVPTVQANGIESRLTPSENGDSEFTLTWQRRRNETMGTLLNSATITVILWDSENETSIEVAEDLSAYDQTLYNGVGGQNYVTFDANTMPEIAGYEYQGVTYQGNTYNNSYALDELCIQYNRGNSTWYAYEDTKEGYSRDRLDGFPTTAGSGQNRDAQGTLHVNYTPVEEPTPTGNVTITNTFLTNGRLTAEYTGNQQGHVTYTWYRVTDDGEETLVDLDTGTNKLQNLGDDWVNVSLDVESLCYMLGDSTEALEQKNNIRSTHYTYKVVAKINGEEVGSASLSIPYYAQLVNGSFETPDRSKTFTKYEYNSNRDEWVVTGTSQANSNFSGQANVLLTNDDEDVVWKTTDKYQLIELIRTGSGSLSNHGVTQAPDGKQIAELNAESEGTLYQDVLTVPGSTLTWQLQHRGRNHGDSKTFGGYDTMFVVILPTNKVDSISSQQDVRAIITAAGFNTEEYYTTKTEGKGELKTVEDGKYAGAKVWRITDYVEANESSTKDSWTLYTDTYDVPKDQYVTRFFFAAGATAFDKEIGNDDIAHTVGNLLDDVWFSPELPPPDDDEVRLTITKTVQGLESVEGYSVDVTIQGDNVDETVTLDNFTGDATNGFTASKAITIEIPYSTSTNLTVTESAPAVEGYDLSATNSVDGAASVDGNGNSVQITVAGEQSRTIAFTNTYTPKIPPTTTLTLKKTFAGLSNEEVYYLLFGQSEATEGEAYWDANFSFDVNYCDLKHTDNDGGLKYMAYGTNIPDAVVVPGTSTKVQNGGALKVYAARLLTKPASARAATVTPASLTQNSTTGDWTFETTITVPTCTNANNFITVYEQHGEVPGYAKLGTASTRYTVSLNGATEGQDGYWTGNGKFVCESGKQLEDMKGENDAYWIDGEGEGDQNVRFARLAVTAPTTISFTNNYTGKLDVTKAIGVENEYTDAEAETYTLTLEPAHPTKLDLKSDDGAQHGLSGKRVHYYTTDSSKTTELTIDQNGKITIPNVPVNTDIHFIDLPAIQWKVGEDTSSATVTGYQLGQSVTDENNDVVEDAAHWNGYVTGNEIGSTATNDGIVSVDSSLGSTAVAKATVTNEYTRQMQTLTVKKIVSGGMGSNTDDFNFTITLVDTTKGSEQGYQPYVFTAVPDGLTQKTDESDNKISGSYEFTLSGGEKIEIQLPYGVQATVTEDLDSTSGYKVASRKYNSNDQTGELPTFTNVANQEVTIGVYNEFIEFQNTREAVAPTGLESNHTTPYVLMITAAGMAGLALIGGIVARRIRRRRQE